MGTFLTESMWNTYFNSTFVFDLEYIGTDSDLKNCHIWEIGIQHYATATTFSVTIRPDINPLPPPFSEEFITLTDEELTKRNAVNFLTGWHKLLQWMNGFIPNNSNVLLVAHNAFKADKIMMEIDCKRHGVIMPYNWYFFDSLIYTRRMIPKQQSYTLGDLHRTLFNEDIDNAHSALPDAIALRNVLLGIGQNTMTNCLTGPIYPSYLTSLQAVKWLGPSCEALLFEKNIRSLEQFVTEILSLYALNNHQMQSMPIRQFIISIITLRWGVKEGNATSITDSLISKWLPGTT